MLRDYSAIAGVDVSTAAGCGGLESLRGRGLPTCDWGGRGRGRPNLVEYLYLQAV